jgi:hypothetical protein
MIDLFALRFLSPDRVYRNPCEALRSSRLSTAAVYSRQKRNDGVATKPDMIGKARLQ